MTAHARGRSNAAVALELWECLKALPYLDRYAVYSEVPPPLLFSIPCPLL